MRICQEAFGPIQTIVEGAFAGEVIDDAKWVKELELAVKQAEDKGATPSEPIKLESQQGKRKPSGASKAKELPRPEQSDDLSSAPTLVKTAKSA